VLFFFENPRKQPDAKELTILHFESWPTNILYLDFGLKPAVVSYLTNVIASPPIVLESCSSVQTDRPVF